MNISRRTRTALTRATDNRLSRVYLAAVTATTGYFLFDALFVDHPDASMASVVPWLLTAPLSLLYTLLPDDTLSHVAHRLRRPFPGTAPSA
ncbi:SCO4225 family membrane protein [Streptomyces sp. NPDC096311]|uniref:SCO4225 family membrane protein n=1 Tax=Streptomyces sp. NPDC096311 TaxID=3366083 RepID=UPI00382C6CE5